MKAIAYTAVAATVLWLAAGSAQAQAEEAPLSRAQVVADLAAARAAGTAGVLLGEDSGSFHFAQLQPRAPAPRADIASALAAARRNGELSSLLGEDSGSFALSRQEALAAQARAAAPQMASREGR